MLEYLWLVPAIPLIGSLILILTEGKLPEIPAGIVGAGSIGLSFLFALLAGMDFMASGAESYTQELWTWMSVGGFEAGFTLYLDGVSLVMMYVITGIGFLIHVYATGYMHDDPSFARFFSYMNLFVSAMLILVLGDNLLLLFMGWEGVGLCSYLLIGFWYTDPYNGYCARKAFVITRVGDASMALGLFLLYVSVGTINIQDAMAAAQEQWTVGSGVAVAVTLLLLGGAVGKSAQLPLQTWLPDAMAGPTPISALIHAATMVTAGVYLVARSSVLFALAPVSQITVAGIGALTALFAATIGLVQTDIKKVLAYSTVSQLGYMFIGVGVGAFAAGIFHLMTHAFFKALLFLGSGAVIHAMHEALHHTHSHADAQDMRNMGGLKKYMPVTWVTMWIGTLAIAGIWPFAGFFSKDEIIWMAAAHAVGPFETWFRVVWVIALIAALLTAFYMTRLMVMTFHGENRTGERERGYLREVPPVMWVPLVVLAVLSVVGGWINVPEAIGHMPILGWIPHSEWLHEWLHPLTETADGIMLQNAGELAEQAPLGGGAGMWAAISFALATAVVVITASTLGRRRFLPADQAETPTGFLGVLYNKWYVDEIYDAIVVRPVLALSRFFARYIDRGVIDGLANGAGYASRAFGWVNSRVQTGLVNGYAFMIVLGALLLLAFMLG